MLQEARGYIRSDAWYGICPGLLLIVMVLVLNHVADIISRHFDPRRAETSSSHPTR